ncbi:class I SAM-dependent methyltransferase [Microlunatus speluncae]|uniref:class I SAM-dependent methyltransferase n=1 Tax=Microlunatus speluncae TaxID=2594267 RepID=UPI00126648F0|nr:class I SAM-dependent methyltransferase [Microlunatus speluncae]
MSRDAEDHGRNLERVYGPLTWTLYEQLDVSSNPRSPDWLRGLAAGLLPPDGSVLDAGCRDAAHLIQLARDLPGITGVGVEPVPVHVRAAEEAVVAAGLSDRVKIILGEIATVAGQGRTFDLVWCRDVLEQVADLPGAVADLARLTGPAGLLVVFTTVTTELLAPAEAALLGHHLGNVAANLSRDAVEAAFTAAGLATVATHEIGTEWREWSEERGRPVSKALLRLARLRRDRARFVAAHGAEIVAHVEANLHWEAYQFLGKLLPIVYVLRPEPDH